MIASASSHVELSAHKAKMTQVVNTNRIVTFVPRLLLTKAFRTKSPQFLLCDPHLFRAIIFSFSRGHESNLGGNPTTIELRYCRTALCWNFIHLVIRNDLAQASNTRSNNKSKRNSRLSFYMVFLFHWKLQSWKKQQEHTSMEPYQYFAIY